jgi:2-polyprenyl-3-methyl-5-hydroxy-6-metoxy-1,4-benzoquinol methylase
VEHMNLIDVKRCPICGLDESKVFLNSKDYSTSKESFSIRECGSCSFRFTSPIPAEDKIGEYYQSKEYISHTDSSAGLMNKVYRLVRKLAIKKKEQLARNGVLDKSLLDIGCGTGDFLSFCKTNGWNVLGLEPDNGARAICKEKQVETHHIDHLHHLPESSFSVVTMWHVLEHVYHLNRDFNQIRKILKPEGKLIIAVPNCSSHDAQKYGKFWAAYDLPIHLYHFRPGDMRRFAEKHDFSVDQILPMKYDSYYVSMLSEKYKNGNLFNAFLSGFMSNRKATKGSNKYSSQIYILSKNRVEAG